MNDKLSDDTVRRAISEVKHPEIDATLTELGMIRNIEFKEDKAIVLLALPAMGIPKAIKDLIVGGLEEKVKELGVEPEINLTKMNQEERKNFFELEREKWSGL